MTDDPIARGDRAYHAREFVGPILDELRQGYRDRIVEVASKELNAKRRNEALHALSVAMRIVDQFDGALQAIIEAGDLEKNRNLKAENIEGLGKSERRLLDIGSW